MGRFGTFDKTFKDKENINSAFDKILVNSKDIILGNYTSFMNNINGKQWDLCLVVPNR